MRRGSHRGGRYTVFVRTWWKRSPGSGYPHDLEPSAGNKEFLDYAATEEGARKIAQRYNASHDPGELSKKAEYEENY